MKKVSLFLLIAITLFIAPQTNALTINIAPGAGPASGYLSLSLFGVTPIAGINDDSIVNFNAPAFSYAGETWNRVGVVSNGYIVVGGGTNADVQFINQQFPNPTQPNNVLAPFWTDLNPAVGGAVRIAILTDGINTWIVTDWAEVPNSSDNTQLNSFEAWIGINGVEDIVFSYGPVTDGNGGFLTVGAEDKTGTVGYNYYYNGNGINLSNTELRVTTSGAPVQAVPEPATMLLLGSGLIGLAAYGKRKFHKK